MDEFQIRKLNQVYRGFGNKAENLAFLIRKGFNVPNGFVLKFKDTLPSNAACSKSLKPIIESLTDKQSFYVVRSSANAEDTTERSFAGQFESVLNLKGSDQILSAL